MIRYPLLILATGLIVSAAQAQTNTASDDPTVATLPVTGSVPDLCILGDPKLDAGSATLNVAAVAGRVVQVAELIDPTTLSTRATKAAIAIDAMCNRPYVVSIVSANNGLWRESPTAPAPNGFGNAVPYFADIKWYTNSVRLDANAMSRSPRSAGFSSTNESVGPLTIDLNILPGSTNAVTRAPLLAGVYRDTLTITVSPQ